MPSPTTAPPQVALRSGVPQKVLAEVFPRHYADYIRNAPVGELNWGTRASPQPRQPIGVPSAHGGATSSYRAGSGKALYFGGAPQQQQQQQQQQQPGGGT